jgi:hypothetical protein
MPEHNDAAEKLTELLKVMERMGFIGGWHVAHGPDSVANGEFILPGHVFSVRWKEVHAPSAAK